MTDFNWVIYVDTWDPIIISVSGTNHTLPTKNLGGNLGIIFGVPNIFL